jgi:DNA-binding response OmpR family regulator
LSLTAVCVDDSTPELDYIARILTSHGVKVVHKDITGTGGLQAVKRFRPTLVTLDLQLTQMHGKEVLTAIVAAGIPTLVFVASGSGQDSLKRACKDLGATDFFVKPYDDVLTWRMIEHHLRERGLEA